MGRSLRGNVDRNIATYFPWSNGKTVVPYVGTWIEIEKLSTIKCYNCGSFPTWERG